MKTVVIIANFDGYPDGVKRSFVIGETPSLDEAYADLLIAKCLAEEPLNKLKPPARSGQEKQS